MRLALVGVTAFVLGLDRPPRAGDWSCWAAHMSKPCSAAHIAAIRDEAAAGAMEACEEFCGRICALDYCERIGK
jgi:hypothetical protein